MVHIIPLLPKLVRLGLPRYHATTAVLQVMAELPHLEYVDLDGVSGDDDPLDSSPITEPIRQLSFPSLRTFALATNIPRVIEILNMDFASNLTGLYLRIPQFEDRHSWKMLFDVIVARCPALVKLEVSEDDLPEFGQRVLTAVEQLSFETLRPLLKCAGLQEFEIRHEYPLILTMDDLEVISRAWPQARSILLNVEPLVRFHRNEQSHSALPLEALLPFARNSHQLHTLGLYMDARDPETSIDEWNVDPHVPLVKTLHVGTSTMQVTPSSSIRLALILQRIFPKLTFIDPEVKTYCIDDNPEFSSSRGDWILVQSCLQVGFTFNGEFAPGRD